jgi:hypothetical protein
MLILKRMRRGDSELGHCLWIWKGCPMLAFIAWKQQFISWCPKRLIISLKKAQSLNCYTEKITTRAVSLSASLNLIRAMFRSIYAAVLIFVLAAKLLAADGTTALSTYRVTQEGETFFHYGYAEDAASFENGLFPGSYTTTIGDLSGAEAQSGLALPHVLPPDATYSVTPEAGTWIRVNPITEPLDGMPGGFPEYQFPFGTGPGTVSLPTSIP